VVQGVGKVGSHLCGHLFNEGAELYITDINEAHIQSVLQSVKATVIPCDEIFDVDADIYSPNALGGVINDSTINRLKVKIIAGGANNQLAIETVHGSILKEKGILYAPDYVINAGGLINVANELEGYSRDRALKQADGIYDILRSIFAISNERGIHTSEVSNQIAENRIASISRINHLYSGTAGYGGRYAYLYGRND
jgi:leucine dehydrogenase